MKDASIDSSSLNVLVRRNDLVDRFAARIVERDLRLVIPSSVADEIHGGDLPERVLARAKLIGRLYRILGAARISVARPSYLIQREELEHEVRRTPTVSKNTYRALFSYFQNIFVNSPVLDRVMQACAEVARDSQASLEVDRAARASVDSEGLLDSPAQRLEIERLFDAFVGPYDDFQWYFDEFLTTDKMLAGHLKIPVSNLRNQTRYKANRISMSLAWLTIYGGSLSGRSANEKVRLFITKENNWFDNVITTSAAYSQYFIVDDLGAKRKAEFLVQVGMAEFIPITIEEFCN